MIYLGVELFSSNIVVLNRKVLYKHHYNSIIFHPQNSQDNCKENFSLGDN